MQSDLKQLNINDVLKSLLLAVFAAIITFLYGAIQDSQFTLATIDWNEMAKVVVSSILSYLMKNYLSDANGKFLGKI
jgi:hypothetical protein